MREIITLQIGQCGNYIGREVWQTILNEHKIASDASSTFLHERSDQQSPYARALLIDMEEGVLNAIKTSYLGPLFSKKQYISSTDGSGNNFAEGFVRHGDEQKECIYEALRMQAEQCDSLQGFFTFSSLGGGTGSGLGSKVVQLAREQFDKTEIISSVVAPGSDSDVVVAPYNETLALSYFMENANLVIPFDNTFLYERCAYAKQKAIVGTTGKQKRDFSAENNLIATVASLLTTSMRFGGELNMDLNEISQNVVPFSKANLAACAVQKATAGMPAAIRSLVYPQTQLTGYFRRQNLAVACVTRGCPVADVFQGVQQIARSIELPEWGAQGMKTSVCDGLRVQPAACGLYNSAAATDPVRTAFYAFYKMRRAKFGLHHYLKYMEEREIDSRAELVRETVSIYDDIEARMRIQPYALQAAYAWNRVLVW